MRKVRQKQIYKEFYKKYGRFPFRAGFGVDRRQTLGFVNKALGYHVKEEQLSQDERRYLRDKHLKSRGLTILSKSKSLQKIRRTSNEFRKRLLKRKTKHNARSE